MNKLEARWVVGSIAFAFLPLALLFEPIPISAEHPPLYELFQAPVLLFAMMQLAVLAVNFTLLGIKALAFKYYRSRVILSVALMILAFIPVYLAGSYSVSLAREFLPHTPIPFVVVTFALLGSSVMFMVRALEIWTVPAIALERLARIKRTALAS